jgi:imidazolonepropionase-like amidohydrolase
MDCRVRRRGDSAVSDEIRIVADFLIDGSGAPPMKNPEIRVRDGRFFSVGSTTQLEAEDGGHLLRFPGCTAIPGLIDSHVHLSLSPDVAAADVARDVATTPDDQLLLRAERNARLALLAGVTTLRDCGGPNNIPLVLRDAIRAGVVRGPRLLVSGRPITTTGGHCHFMGERADSEDEMRRATRSLCRDGVDFIKVMATGGMLTPGSNPAAAQYSVAELKACVEEAHRLGRRVAAHVLCSEGIRFSVAAGIDTIEHCWSIAGGPQDADVETIERLAASGSFGSVTAHRSLRGLLTEGLDGLAELRRRLAPHRAMRQAGVALPVHSDAGIPGTRFESFRLSVEAYRRGLETSIEEAVRAATHVPAAALGLGDRLGKVAPGYISDLVIIRGDPNSDDFLSSEVVLVMLQDEMVVENGRIAAPHSSGGGVPGQAATAA